MVESYQRLEQDYVSHADGGILCAFSIAHSSLPIRQYAKTRDESVHGSINMHKSEGVRGRCNRYVNSLLRWVSEDLLRRRLGLTFVHVHVVGSYQGGGGGFVETFCHW